MNKGKTNYSFTFNTDPNVIDSLVKEWLNVNHFILTNKDGENFYFLQDDVYGSRGFQYNINENAINVYAWTIGMGNQYYMLDSGALNNSAGNSYKELLSILFNKIQEVSNGGNVNMNNTYQQGPIQQGGAYNQTQTSGNFEDEAFKRNAKFAEISFWIALVAFVIMLLFGLYLGIYIHLVILGCGIIGLKSRKKKKAIATIVIEILAILYIIFAAIILPNIM